jgi:hypothetical protein
MRNLYNTLIIFAVSLMLISCDKELSAIPQNAKVDANTILDPATAQIALNGAYYYFANASNIKNDWLFHQVTPARLTGYISSGFGIGPGADTNQNDLLGDVEGCWSESYKTINAANGVVKGVNALADNTFTGAKKNELLAEVRFLRAYSCSRLLLNYAEWFKADSKLGILIRDELSSLDNIPKARSTVKESYDFIFADLDFAITNGPAVRPNYFATKWAAELLKIRLLICRGSSSDYTEAIRLADDLIQKSPYVLEANAMDIFRTKGLASSEIILGLKPQALQVSDPYSKSRKYYPSASTLFVATQELKDLYNNDPRQNWIIGPASAYVAYSPNTSYFSKYIPFGGVPTVTSETDYGLRLTEAYLLKAEAVIKSGGSLADARTLIHTIQSKAGITATANNVNYLAVENAVNAVDLSLELYKETVRSMVAEDGIEWNSLRRLPFETVKQLRPTITSLNQYLIPVPITEFQFNPLFGDQNPGYSKN